MKDILNLKRYSIIKVVIIINIEALVVIREEQITIKVTKIFIGVVVSTCIIVKVKEER